MAVLKEEDYQRLSRYVDGDLTLAEKKAVEKELKESKAKNDHYHFLLMVRQQMIPDEKNLPADFHQNLMKRYQLLTETKKRPSIFRMGLVMAACFVLIVVYFQWGNHELTSDLVGRETNNIKGENQIVRDEETNIQVKEKAEQEALGRPPQPTAALEESIADEVTSEQNAGDNQSLQSRMMTATPPEVANEQPRKETKNSTFFVVISIFILAVLGYYSYTVRRRRKRKSTKTEKNDRQK